MLVKIRTDYDDSPWIAAGKIYEAALVETGRYAGTYKFIGELGSPCYTRLERSIHINGKDWEIVE